MTFLTRPWLRRLTAASCMVSLTLGWGLVARAQTSPEETNPESTSEESPESPETTDPQAEESTTDPAEAVSSFACQMHNGRPTVMYAPSSQPGQMYPWAVPQDLGSAWPAERRCEAISARLESYRPDGLLTLDTGIENGYNIVCVTTESVPGCRIVFTVPPGQDPALTRNQVFENLASADGGQQTVGVNTFVGGSSDVLGQIGELLGQPSLGSTPVLGSQSINLKPFLAPSDGGTGARLTQGNAATDGRPLNPDNFR